MLHLSRTSLSDNHQRPEVDRHEATHCYSNSDRNESEQHYSNAYSRQSSGAQSGAHSDTHSGAHPGAHLDRCAPSGAESADEYAWEDDAPPSWVTAAQEGRGNRVDESTKDENLLRVEFDDATRKSGKNYN